MLRKVIPLTVILLVLLPACSKQARKERHLQRANAYFEAKAHRKAEIEYLNALRLDPTNQFVLFRLGSIYYTRGHLARAVPFFMRARDLDPSAVAARLKVGQIFFAGGQFPRAREEAWAALTIEPANEEALLLLADSAHRAQEIEEVRARLDTLQAQLAQRPAWHLASATLALRQTNIAGAELALLKAQALDPKSSRVYVALGVLHAFKGDLGNAEQSFQTAAQLNPDDAALRLRLADIQMRSGSTNRASKLLQQIMTDLPDYSPAWLYRARLAFAMQDLDQCSTILERLLLQDPTNYDGRLLRSSVWRAQGRIDEAIKELEEIKRNYPRAADISVQLALAHLRKHDLQRAILSLNQALAINPDSLEASLLLAELNLQRGEIAPAVAALERIIKKYPNASRAYFLLASSYSADRKFDEAVALYTRLGTASPTNAAIPFLTGLALRQQGKAAEARMFFTQALGLAPDDLLISYHLVELDLLDKNYGGAAERVASLLQKSPESPGVKFLQARVFLAQTNTTGAEAALLKTIELDPNFVSAYHELARIYLASDRFEAAIKNLQAILERHPRNIGTLMMLGTLYDQTGQLTKAVDSYRAILKVSPYSVAALNNLAYLLSEKLNNLEEAYDYAVKARDLAPQQPNVADTLGWICFRRQDYRRASILLQESALALPLHPEVQYHLAMAQYIMDNEAAARAAFHRVLQLAPRSTIAVQSSNCIAVLDLNTNTANAGVRDFLEHRIRLMPEDVPSLLRLGRHYEMLGITKKARDMYEQARKVNPGSIPVLLELVRIHSEKDPRQAQHLAREARKLAPEDPKVAHLLGSLALQLNDHSWAHSLLRESAARLPESPAVLLDLAYAHFAVGQVDEAEATAIQVLNLEPFDGRAQAETLLQFVRYIRSPNDRLEAEALIQERLQRSPAFLPAAFVAALLHEQHGRMAEARDALEGILATHQQFAPAMKHLAAIYSDRFNDQQKALDYGSKARQLLPQDNDLPKTLGKIAFRRGDYRAAGRWLAESARTRHNDAEVLYFLGITQFHLKETAQSKQHLHRALALNPDGPFAAEAQKILAVLSKS